MIELAAVFCRQPPLFFFAPKRKTITENKDTNIKLKRLQNVLYLSSYSSSCIHKAQRHKWEITIDSYQRVDLEQLRDRSLYMCSLVCSVIVFLCVRFGFIVSVFILGISIILGILSL